MKPNRKWDSLREQLYRELEAEKEARKQKGLTGLKNRFISCFNEVCQREQLNIVNAAINYHPRSLGSYKDVFGWKAKDVVNLAKLIKMVDSTDIQYNDEFVLSAKTVFIIETIFQHPELWQLYNEFNKTVKAKVPKTTRTGVPKKPTHIISLGRGKR